MNNLNLTSEDFRFIKNVIRKKYRNFKLSPEDIDDLIQNGILKLIEYNNPIINNPTGFVLFHVKRELLMWNRGNMVRNKYSTILKYDDEIKQKYANNDPYEYYLKKDILIKAFNDSKYRDLYNNFKVIDNISQNKYKILCLTTGELFSSMYEAERFYKLTTCSISKNIRGTKKSAGKMNGHKLVWKKL